MLVSHHPNIFLNTTHNHAGSSLQFTTSHPSVQPGLTKDLTLRCSLLDSIIPHTTPTATSGGLVGRRRRSPTHAQTSHKETRSLSQTVTQSNDDVSFVLSMHIIRWECLVCGFTTAKCSLKLSFVLGKPTSFEEAVCKRG